MGSIISGKSKWLSSKTYANIGRSLIGMKKKSTAATEPVVPEASPATPLPATPGSSPSPVVNSAPLTAGEIAAGIGGRRRRGRLATILTQALGDQKTEYLG